MHNHHVHEGLTLITKPDDAVVSLAEARQHLRIPDDDTTQDTLILKLLLALDLLTQNECRRAFVTQTWRLTLDAFPGCWGLYSVTEANRGHLNHRVRATIQLPLPPTQSVTSVKYIDQAGVEQTLVENTDYQVDLNEPCRIAPAYLKTWPVTRRQLGAVKIEFVAGYGEPSDVPECVNPWILLQLGAMYENREAVAVDTRIALVAMPFVSSILDPVRFYG
jgi:hypothetical protein